MKDRKTDQTGATPEPGAPEGDGSITWSGLSVDEARDFAAGRQDPDLPRIASALKARLDEQGRSPLDAGEPYAAVDHALLFAYEAKGRRLHALVVGEILGAFGRSLGNLARRYLLDPIIRRNEVSRRLQQLRRLDNRMLKDIGVNRSEIEFVARRNHDPRSWAA